MDSLFFNIKKNQKKITKAFQASLKNKHDV